MQNTSVINYVNRQIQITPTSIILMDMRDNKINGTVNVYNKLNGKLQWSCEYVDNAPYGMYKEYNNGILKSKQFYQSPDHQLITIATKCAKHVLS